MRESVKIGFALLAVGAWIPLGCSQKKEAAYGEHSAAHATHDESSHGDQQADGEDMAGMMEAFAKASQPGPNHHHLSPLVGKWDAVGKYRFTPDAPWEESHSKAEFTWIMGGRFLTQKVFGEPMMPEMPSFEGYGIFGYDNHAKKYISFWVDNYGTMMMTGEGTCDETGKTFTFKSTFTDPMSGQPTWMRSVYKIESNDRVVLSMYGPDPTGKEFLTMEIINTRTG